MRTPAIGFVTLLGLSLSWVVASPRPASSQLLGPEFQVNTYTVSFQDVNAVAADGSGNFVVVWESYTRDGSQLGIFGQRFDATGLPLGSEFPINTYTTGWQMWPDVARSDLGSFLVVWEGYLQDGSSEGVFARRFDAAGLPVGNDFQVNSFTPDWQSSPQVAADGLGNFVVVWQSLYQDGSGWGVFGQRFDSAGLPLGGEFQVNSTTVDDQYRPAVAADGAGRFVVVWENHFLPLLGISGQRFDAAGAAVGGEFQVNSYTTSYQDRPEVAASVAGDFLVVWESYSQDGSGWGVFGQRFDPAGLPVGGEFQVNTFTTLYQDSAAVAADAAGNFVVVWRSYGEDGSQTGVFGQQFDSSGLRVGSEFRVNSYTARGQDLPSVARTGVRNFVVAWTSSGQVGAQTDVFARRATSPFFYGGFESGDFSAWSLVCQAGDVCP